MKLWIVWDTWHEIVCSFFLPQIYTKPVEGALEVDSSIFEEAGSGCLFDYDTFELLAEKIEAQKEEQERLKEKQRLKAIEQENMRKQREIQARAEAYQREKAELFAIYPKKQHKQLRIMLKDKYHLP